MAPMRTTKFHLISKTRRGASTPSSAPNIREGHGEGVRRRGIYIFSICFCLSPSISAHVLLSSSVFVLARLHGLPPCQVKSTQLTDTRSGALVGDSKSRGLTTNSASFQASCRKFWWLPAYRLSVARRHLRSLATTIVAAGFNRHVHGRQPRLHQVAIGHHLCGMRARTRQSLLLTMPLDLL